METESYVGYYTYSYIKEEIFRFLEQEFVTTCKHVFSLLEKAFEILLGLSGNWTLDNEPLSYMQPDLHSYHDLGAIYSIMTYLRILTAVI